MNGTRRGLSVATCVLEALQSVGVGKVFVIASVIDHSATYIVGDGRVSAGIDAQEVLMAYNQSPPFACGDLPVGWSGEYSRSALNSNWDGARAAKRAPSFVCH
jgi:hypothetical protein